MSTSLISNYLDVDKTYYEKIEDSDAPVPTILLDNLAVLYGIKLSDFDLDEIKICDIDYQKYSGDLKDIANINRIAINLKK